MLSRISYLSLLLVASALLAGCRPSDVRQGNTPGRSILQYSGLSESFGDYWYQGTAEITSYELEQARYGGLHSGSAVTIFVTEDFSRQKQVKLDDPYGSPEDAVKVLKLNATRRFNTGIYPYSIMTSVFTPVYRDRDPSTLKVTSSVQEWCGQTFAQINRGEDDYRVRHYSYFEQDGDGDRQLQNVILEDELWNIIRLNPADLPTGSIQVLPGAAYQRLNHSNWTPVAAIASLQTADGDTTLTEYRLQYPELGRELLIRYGEDFPHQIDYWEESQETASSGPPLVTRATLKKRIMIDYWTRNHPEDVGLRDLLEL